MPRRTRIILILLVVCMLIVGTITLVSRSDSTASVSGATAKATKQKPASATNFASASFNKTRLSRTDPGSIWVVVNKHHPLSQLSYAPTDLTAVGNGQYLRAEAATALARMLSDAKQAGLTITPASAYRSYTTQVTVYNREVATNGQAVADSQSARPGYSEHQTGFGVDLAGGGCYIEDCFGETAEGKWAADNAYKYGYILRYTPDDTPITGYRAESWHFRYVGVDLAAELRKQKVATLEEFFGISGGADYR
ncbi:MAG TPA: M15 family metallopeptidase [Candidatus Saccharimonadales bacterium]|jgi:D-alanyl-D-alanine carboxypeptidase